MAEFQPVLPQDSGALTSQATASSLDEVDEESSNMSPWAVASRWADTVVTHGDFENFIMFIIAGTIITLALQDPLQGDMEGRNLPLYWLGELSCMALMAEYFCKLLRIVIS